MVFMTSNARRGNASIEVIAILLVCVAFVVIALAAYTPIIGNVMKFLGITADPKMMTLDRSAALVECNAACIGNKYDCDAKYTVKDPQGNTIKSTETCGDFFRMLDSEDQGHTIGDSLLSLSNNEEFMPCNTMTVTVNDGTINEIASMKVKVNKRGEATNLVTLESDGLLPLAKDGDFYKICAPCKKAATGKIEVKFKIACTDPSKPLSRAVEPDEVYTFTVETTGALAVSRTFERTFQCKDTVIFQNASQYKPDGVNPGEETRVVFTRDFAKIKDMSMKANVYVDQNNNNPMCFTVSSPYVYGTCTPERDVTPTTTPPTKDPSGRTIYKFTMRQIKDTDYKKDTRMVFRVLSGGVDVCHPWRRFSWHCPQYVCYNDATDGNKKKVLTSPADANGDGQVLPGCKYSTSALCDEGCYKIGSATLATPPIAAEANCKPEDGNIWRESCYDAAYVANNNPSRCKVSNLKVEQLVKICTWEPLGSDQTRCYVLPFRNDDDKKNILIHEDLNKFRTLVIVTYISNTGNTKVPISTGNVDIKFDGKEPKANSKYFVKVYASLADMSTDTGTSILDTYYKLDPGKIIVMESHFDMPTPLTEPKNYEMSVKLSNIDVDVVPAADRTADNAFGRTIRINYDCCKSCPTCPIDRCESCSDLCRKMINDEGTAYECKR